MKPSILVSGAIVAVSVSTTAISQVTVQRMYTGELMLSHCVSESSYREICLGYLAGIFDAHGVFVGLGVPQYFCAPRGIDPEQLRKIFVKYVSEDPRRNELAAASLALNAFKGTFPCS